MANKYTITGSLLGVIVLVSVFVSQLYVSDYRNILEGSPHMDLFLLGYTGGPNMTLPVTLDKFELLMRGIDDGPEFVRWKYQDDYSKVYFGSSDLKAKTRWRLRCYLPNLRTGKFGYRYVNYKTGNWTLKEIDETSAALVYEGDFYLDSRKTRHIGHFKRTVELYPKVNKESFEFTHDYSDGSLKYKGNDWSCTAVMEVTDLDGLEESYRWHDTDEPEYGTEYRQDDDFFIDWSDAGYWNESNKNGFATAKGFYTTNKIQLVSKPTKHYLKLDPTLGLVTYSMTDGQTVFGVDVYNVSLDNLDSSWYNNSNLSWHQEVNDTIVNSGVQFFPGGGMFNISYTPDLYFGTNNFTIEFWVKPQNHPSQDYRLFSQSQYSTDGSAYHIIIYYQNAENIQWYYVTSGGTHISLWPSVNWTKNEWHHVVARVLNGQAEMFVDRVSIGSQAFSGTPANLPYPMRVGYGWQGEQQWSNMTIDEYRIYNGRALSNAEINNSYERGLNHLVSNNSEDNLTFYYPFDHNADDFAGNHDGTFTGDTRITGRSSEREFPLKVYSVLTGNLLALYNGLNETSVENLFMTFYEGSGNALETADYSSVDAKEGKVVVGGSKGVIIVDFPNDEIKKINSSGTFVYGGNISQRNDGAGFS